MTDEEATSSEGPNRSPDQTSASAQRIAELEALLAEREGKLREAVALYEQEKSQLTHAMNRIEREAKKQLGMTQEAFLASFLEVLDDVDRALDVAAQTGSDPAIREGLALIAQRFLAKLHEHGVNRLQKKSRFDPKYHEAVATVAVTRPQDDGAIIDIVAHGYAWGEKILRPARVVVGKFSE